MSTNSDQWVLNLIEKLKINKELFAKNYSIDVLTFISTLYTSMALIWERVELKTYTDHGLKHSERIIDIFLSLEQIYETKTAGKWGGKYSDKEKVLFVTAALIHDIGMQYNEWRLDPEDYEILEIPPELQNDEVRKQHGDLGFLLIINYLQKRLKTNRWPNNLIARSNNSDELLYEAAYIAFSHSSEKVIVSMIKEYDTFKRKSYSIGDGGNICRYYLLTGLLRLCDELDCVKDRVIRTESISSPTIPDLSKAHWLACYFIEGLNIEINHDENNVHLAWRIPSQENLAIIREFLEKKVSEILSEIIWINIFFKEVKEPEYAIDLHVKLRQNPRTIPFDSNLDIKELLTKYRFSVFSSSPALPPNLILKEEKKNPDINFSTNRSLEQELQIWFDANKVGPHFELVNGVHTNFYLNCRTLASNQNLINRISDKIVSIFMKRDIGSILAVGTSAIPLSVNVAIRLNASVSFTFLGSDNKRPNSKVVYNNYEIDPNIKLDKNLLIIDDVISGGNVAIQVLDSIGVKKTSAIKIYHFAIFKLGNRDHIIDDRITSYEFIHHIPDIYYSRDKCDLCMNNQPFIKESDGLEYPAKKWD